MNVRRATPLDATLLAEHRAAVWHEVGDWSLSELMPHVPVWAAFFRARLGGATYAAFIAEERAGVVGSGGILIHLTLPRPGSTAESAGRVQSVYVVPLARRAGVARTIMQHVLDYARATGLASLTLHPSDEARQLYAGLGFQPADEMSLRLTPK